MFYVLATSVLYDASDLPWTFLPSQTLSRFPAQAWPNPEKHCAGNIFYIIYVLLFYILLSAKVLPCHGKQGQQNLCSTKIFCNIKYLC